ncbi:succinyldiaminopimelate transaminase [Halioxenophilus sp. WMMB6]|uniref:succinyldiaminopimelate transaminase n=1 Tax=Halioxenophilus sp. WMMB6 TaxID=3073815 RepID=UPI00295F4F92|nr:succinyldiaminopimelate transaminase [Halioxenophilus sp. WMMB6]
MNPDLTRLHSYPFEKLAELKSGITPPADRPHISLSIGEPKHPAPEFALAAIRDNLDLLSNYPVTGGTPAMREAAASWASNRYQLSHLNASQVIPVNGTREALFAIAQAVVDRSQQPIVMMPNPFYQIYEGAALLAGAEPYYLNCTAEQGYLPDYQQVPEAVWQRCQLLYLCNPGNPTGAVMPAEQLRELIELADRYDFVIASDECYSEIHFEQPPTGLLTVCEELGRHDYRRCVVFQSLSKRSNLPGLRSGFVAGDQAIITPFLHYRTYHGCAMPLTIQAASSLVWQDETHVAANRALYAQKFAQVLPVLQTVLAVQKPDAAFFLWAKTPIDDQAFARELFAAENVTVLPGSYLARTAQGTNPGVNHVRMALVAEVEECLEAAHRIQRFVQGLAQ